eukprot:403358945
MSDEIVNELLSNLETQRIQLDQVTAENQKLQNENQHLRLKVQELTNQLIDSEMKSERQSMLITRSRTQSEANSQLLLQEEQKEEAAMNKSRKCSSDLRKFQEQPNEESKEVGIQQDTTINVEEEKKESVLDLEKQSQQDNPDEIEMTIEYKADNSVKPEEEILIMGEFNNWMPDLMQRVQGQYFEYKVKVTPGFKYRYQFIVNGEICIDPTQDNSESKLGRLTNYKYALRKDPRDVASNMDPDLLSFQKMPSYVHPTMKAMYHNQFEQLQKQNTLIRDKSIQGQTKEEIEEELQDQAKSENLYRYMQRTKYLIEKLKRLREMLTLAEVAEETQNMEDTKEQMRMADQEYQKLTQNIKTIVSGRYAYSLDANPVTFIIKEYRQTTNEIILKRLYDQNGILLDDKAGLMINLVATNESSFFTNYALYSLQDENDIKRDQLNNKEHTFTVKYQLLPIDDNEVECMPVEIYPVGVNINDYNIRFDKGQDKITEITNKQYGLVKYNCYRIDEECGYVRGSVTKIYTSEFSGNMLNIIHVHVNDTSEEVGIDVAYMEEEQTIKDFEEFKVDYTGQVLRYKILVRNQQIFTILYNTGYGTVEEIPFNEIRLTEGQKFAVLKSNKLDFSDKTMLVEIEKIPISMMACLDKKKLQGLLPGQVRHNMNGFCADRCFERLPGFIDVNILSIDDCQSLLPEETKLAIPVCLLSDPDEFMLAQYSSLIDQSKSQKSQILHQSLEKIEEIIHRYESNQSEITKNLNEMQEIFSNLQQLESNLEQQIESQSSKKGGSDTDVDLMMKIKSVLAKSGLIQRRLAAEIRVAKMKKH